MIGNGGIYSQHFELWARESLTTVVRYALLCWSEGLIRLANRPRRAQGRDRMFSPGNHYLGE